jgi:hypothetical protein
MKRLATTVLFALTACGSLDNEPLSVGVIRGQLANADASALVSVVGRVDLLTTPDAQGHFELQGVPLGTADLFVVINARESRRLSVQVGAASIVELGAVAPAPSAHFEVYVSAPGGQAVTGGTVSLVGTPLGGALRPPEDELEFRVPAGCYQALVSVPGLGTATVSGCVEAGGLLERRVTLEEPDGSAGREGCGVSGCKSFLTCQADRSCR